MREPRGGCFCYLIVAVLLFLPPLLVDAGGDAMDKTKHCNPSKLDEQCGKHGRCIKENDETGHCECERDFRLLHDECVQDASTVVTNATTVKPEIEPGSGGGSSVAAGLLIPTFLVAIGVVLYFGAKRYKWLQRFRQFRQNRYGNVLVTRDDDDDDVPPIP